MLFSWLVGLLWVFLHHVCSVLYYYVIVLLDLVIIQVYRSEYMLDLFSLVVGWMYGKWLCLLHSMF